MTWTKEEKIELLSYLKRIAIANEKSIDNTDEIKKLIQKMDEEI